MQVLVQAGLGKQQGSISEIIRAKMARGLAQEVESEVLSSNSSAGKKTKRWDRSFPVSKLPVGPPWWRNQTPSGVKALPAVQFQVRE
jgi:hypothetical protein